MAKPAKAKQSSPAPQNDNAKPDKAADQAQGEARNYDPDTRDAFSDQWERFEKHIHELDSENKMIFDRFFYHFPWDKVNKKSKGFDMGCGRGRFLKFVAPHIGELNAVDVSPIAIQNAQKRNADLKNVKYHNRPVGDNGLKKGGFDFGYSFGVLMCVPDTQGAIQDCADLLKPGAPFCLYMYYSLDNRPAWYKAIWRASDLIRQGICKLPKSLGFLLTDAFAAFVYWPFARAAALAEKMGANVHNWPLSDYRNTSFIRMRGTSRDRFGTPLEKRFSRAEMEEMMQKAGFKDIKYYDGAPYWCLCGIKEGEEKKKPSPKKKTPAKKTAVKKVTAKKTTTKKTTAKKASPKKATAKKTTTKKTTAKSKKS